MDLSRATFFGYKRENGRIGVRNHVVILPVDDLSNAAAQACGDCPVASASAVAMRARSFPFVGTSPTMRFDHVRPLRTIAAVEPSPAYALPGP